MFPVEFRIADEDALTEKMTEMLRWLDYRRFEPSTFRFAFDPRGMLFRIDFAVEAEAAALAKEFGGRVVVLSTGQSAPAADQRGCG